LAAALAATLLLAATSSRAHEEDHHRLQGDSLKLSWSAATPQRGGLAFKTKRQIAINTLPIDPTVQASSLLVRTTGPGAATTGPLRLDPFGWRGIGRDASKGWRYRGSKDDPAAGGIRSIKLKYSPLGGALTIKAKGEHWPLALAGPVDSAELMLTLADHVFCSEFSAGTTAEFQNNETGRVRASDASPPAACGSSCGNGVLELGEACDDGNDVDDDTCSNACTLCTPASGGLDGTFAALQSVVFDNPVYACTSPVCHGSGAAGGLDLRAGNAYASLVGLASEADPGVLRVFPGDDDASMLYRKLASKTLGDPPVDELPGAAMPVGAAVLAPEYLEAIRLWIRGGAPEHTVVAGTPELLAACLPPPSPLKTPAPPMPASDEGVQLTMPPWPLPSQTENQICVATYYDLSAPGAVPAANVVDCAGSFPGTNDHGTNAGKCLAYGRQLAVQDAQSHHLQMFVYNGSYDADDAGWGDWTCHGGAADGQLCDPQTPSTCGLGVCAGATVTLGDCFPPLYGPPDLLIGLSAPLFLASQEPVLSLDLPSGGYGLLPLKGVLIWNSHAFNFTGEDMSMEAWLNEYYASEFDAVADTFFEGEYIYTQDVPPYETREYCATKTFPEGFTIFELLAHVHKRAKRFRIYGPPQTACPSGGTAPNGFGHATSPSCTPGAAGDLIYESFDYDDPTHLRFDPPWVVTGTAEERTVRYCALYDNGATDPSEVKRASTSPPVPDPTRPGGPCPASERKCVDGPNKAQPCLGDDANCPGSVCDACNLRGGITSDDEMFILVGYSLN